MCATSPICEIFYEVRGSQGIKLAYWVMNSSPSTSLEPAGKRHNLSATGCCWHTKSCLRMSAPASLSQGGN